MWEALTLKRLRKKITAEKGAINRTVYVHQVILSFADSISLLLLATGQDYQKEK